MNLTSEEEVSLCRACYHLAGIIAPVMARERIGPEQPFEFVLQMTRIYLIGNLAIMKRDGKLK